MKTLIILVVGLLAVGCLTPEQKLRDRIIGEYELKKIIGDTIKVVVLENGIVRDYLNGKKQSEQKWTIVDGEIHVDDDSGWIDVHRVNKDKSLKQIAVIVDGKRTDSSHPSLPTYIKIK